MDELPSVEVMRLEPGDIVVATFEKAISPDHCRAALELLRDRFPDHQVIACAGGMKLSVARPVEVE